MDLEHWARVGDRVVAVGEFLEWLQTKYGVVLDWTYASEGTPLDIGKLIDEYFDVDRAKLDRQRRKLLERNLLAREISPE